MIRLGGAGGGSVDGGDEGVGGGANIKDKIGGGERVGAVAAVATAVAVLTGVVVGDTQGREGDVGEQDLGGGEGVVVDLGVGVNGERGGGGDGDAGDGAQSAGLPEREGPEFTAWAAVLSGPCRCRRSDARRRARRRGAGRLKPALMKGSIRNEVFEEQTCWSPMPWPISWVTTLRRKR